jgi:hypothetical protein
MAVKQHKAFSNDVDARIFLDTSMNELSAVFNERMVDVPGVVDKLLQVASLSSVRCDVQEKEIVLKADGIKKYIHLSAQSRSILRAISARLALLSHETTGADAFIYGGQGEVVLDDDHRYHIETKNTTSEQGFEINPIKDVA